VPDNKRILIVDDDPGIRESYENILAPQNRPDVFELGARLFDEAPRGRIHERYDLVLAARGEEGLRAVEQARGEGLPFAAAFVDMKMPGLNGAETARGIWGIDPGIKITIVTAYSEYSPDEIISVAGRQDLFYLRKPFNPEEIRQFARALTNQWNLEWERDQLEVRLKEANATLENLNRDLQQKVEEQTALLVQSEKMASIGILAAGVAHEINNPISFINGNLATLKKYGTRIKGFLEAYDAVAAAVRGESPDDPMDLLEDMVKLRKEYKVDFILEDLDALIHESLEGTDRVRNIVRDLRTFARVDQAEIKTIDLHEALEATLNILRNELKYKAEVIKDYGELPAVKCFPQKIGQAFLNILINAAQAIEQKGDIRISTRQGQDGRRAEDRFVEIRISDTGQGIPKDQISKIFDPFFTSKPVGQGTGLGLSITYDIIKAHGGTISVETEEGKGTTFYVRLPLGPDYKRQTFRFDGGRERAADSPKVQ